MPEGVDPALFEETVKERFGGTVGKWRLTEEEMRKSGIPEWSRQREEAIGRVGRMKEALADPARAESVMGGLRTLVSRFGQRAVMKIADWQDEATTVVSFFETSLPETMPEDVRIARSPSGSPFLVRSHRPDRLLPNQIVLLIDSYGLTGEPPKSTEELGRNRGIRSQATKSSLQRAEATFLRCMQQHTLGA